MFIGVDSTAVEVVVQVVSGIETARAQVTLKGQLAGVKSHVPPVVVSALNDLPTHPAPEPCLLLLLLLLTGARVGAEVGEWCGQTKCLVYQHLNNFLLIANTTKTTTTTTKPPLQQNRNRGITLHSTTIQLPVSPPQFTIHHFY